MSAFTPEQLQKVAEWLGGKSLWHDDGTNSYWYQCASGRNEEIVGNADLFCAIDDKCVANGLAPDLRCEWGDVSGERRYLIFPGGSNGPTIDESGQDRLTAALGAVLRMLEAA